MLMLERLTHLGMALTEDLVADAREAIAVRRATRAAAVAAASAEPAAGPAAEPTPEELAARDPSGLAFTRLTRSLRLCMALAVRFHGDRLDRENGTVKEREAAKTRLKGQLERKVKTIIEVEFENSEHAELKRALRERLEDKDIDIDLLTIPIEEVADRICRDLGIWEEDEPAAAPPAPPREPRIIDHPTIPNLVICEIDLPPSPPRRRRRRRQRG